MQPSEVLFRITWWPEHGEFRAHVDYEDDDEESAPVVAAHTSWNELFALCKKAGLTYEGGTIEAWLEVSRREKLGIGA